MKKRTNINGYKSQTLASHFLHCWINTLTKLHVLFADRQWHLADTRFPVYQYPLIHCWYTVPSILSVTRVKLQLLHSRDSQCLHPGCGSRLTREKGKQLSNESPSDQYTLGLYASPPISDRDRSLWEFQALHHCRLIFSNFCFVFV